MGTATPGAPILQPCPLDGGRAVDLLGRFSRSVPLIFDGHTPEIADASIALATTPVVVGDVDRLGAVTGERDPRTLARGEWVVKLGRSTGLTYGLVLATQAWASIDYSGLGFAGKTVRYHQQIITTGMGAYGDSGSLLV